MTADMHHLAAAYALDALDDVERREFERHYESCEICTAEVAEFRAVAMSLAESTSVASPAGLKSSVMSEITQTRQLSPLVSSKSASSLGISKRMLFAAAAAMIVLAGVVITAFPGSDNADRVSEVVDSFDAVVTTLDPIDADQVGNLQIVWSDDRDQVAVVGSRLDDPGIDKAYALWYLLDEGVVAPAGLFRPEGGSVSELLDVQDLDLNGWGITIEPATGSEQPTTPVIFAGTL